MLNDGSRRADNIPVKAGISPDPQARQNRLIAIRSLEAREANILAESFGRPRRAKPTQKQMPES